ncbi:PREDICTED: probable chitinase 3 [Polistes canadensis]|uniref:probable chitinase 3 n=1 Tax=Polistes canadensis TaxID=91411 RepID=UPI00071906DB|nr:PREDICTED: probable chitinase 3 [Polistes canadensis]
MLIGIILLLIGFSYAGPLNDAPAREILPPLPWKSSITQDNFKFVNELGFQRGAVESPPKSSSIEFDRLQDPIKENAEFGSKRIPLRDAVEALPSSTLKLCRGPKNEGCSARIVDERVPLRDAVEHREAPFFGGIEHESIWIEPLAPPTLGKSQRIVDPKVVCRFDSRATNRMEPFSLLSGSLPDYKCTHLIYAEANLDSDFKVVPWNYEYDEIKGGYKMAVNLRSRDPALRILISIMLPSEIFKSSKLNEADYEKISQSILSFINQHDFDGVLINWQMKDTWQTNAMTDLKILSKILKKHLADEGLTLAIALRAEDRVHRETISNFDLVILKAWREDLHLRKEKYALHPAPLKFAIRAVEKWFERAGMEQASKTILGLPIFGDGYTLKFGNFTDAGAPILGPGLPGPYTGRRNGRLAYYEICERLEEGSWISGRDEDGPYMKRGDQWIGYDDPISLKLKAAYVKSSGLAGISLWSLDLDDFQGICGNPWPMLNTATNALGLYESIYIKKCSKESLFADPDNCSGFYSCVKGKMYHGYCGPKRLFDPVKGRCIKTDPKICKPGYSDTIVLHEAESFVNKNEMKKDNYVEKLTENGPRVVCYVTSWAIYRKSDGKFIPERLDSSLCTDIIYAFASLNPETLLIQAFDPWADLDNGLYERVTSIKGTRVLLALGGWTDSSGDKYSRLISSGVSRRKFISATINFLKKHNFDGLSLEWNYPKCWQSDCRKGPDSDKPNFTKLLQELRKEFNKQTPRLALAVALSGYKEVIDQAYEVAEIVREVDFASVMTYDYHGAWESKTGHLAPLYETNNDGRRYYNVNFTMEYLVRLGADKSKLLLGIPFYGQAYHLSDPHRTELGDPATGPGLPGEFTKQPGMLAYYEICDRIKKQDWTVGSGPSAYHKDQWVGYENRKSVFRKGEYIIQNNYGGASIWTVDLDDFLNRCCVENFPLLKAVNRALGRSRTPVPNEMKENCQRPEEPVTPPEPTMTTHSDAVEDGPVSTKPMSTLTTKVTSWPTWTEKPSTTTQSSWTQKPTSTLTTKGTTWPTWTEKPSTTTQSSWTQKPTMSSNDHHHHHHETSTIRTSTVTWAPSYLPPATTASSTTENIPIPPVSCIEGQYTFDPVDCGSYYRCVLKELKRERCAPGLHWDKSRNICDWPSISKCQTDISTTSTQSPTKKTTISSTQKPTSTTSSTWTISSTHRSSTTKKPVVVMTSTEKPMKECEHGQYYAYPNSCINFLVCVNGNLVSQQCGPGLNWNKEKNMCDWAYKNPCNEKPMKNALLVTKDTTSKNCISGSYGHVPGDCESYVACLWGRQEIFHCAPGLHFNKHNSICDWPSRANCQENVDDKEDKTEKPSTEPHLQNGSPTMLITERPTVTTTQKTTTQSTTQSTTLTPVEIDPDKVSPLSGHFKVVCYFTNWAWYRRGVGRYLPEHIDHTLCTHIVYGFAVLDYSELIIKAHDSWADYDNRFYERVVAYKKRGLKVLLALGGWNDSAGDKYSRLVNNPAARQKFINHAIKFIEKYGFNGLDLDWEYPVCWQVDCKKGPDSDKESFAALIKELSTSLKQKGLLLTAAVSPSKKVIDKGYDVPILAKYLDWIAVMTYDYHGQWDKKTGHVAPMYAHPDDEFYYFNANYSINYWIAKGAPPRSIVMGMPLYGQSFTINDPKAGVGLNAPASAGNAGEFTRAAGFLAYYEICNRIRNHGWTVVQDPEKRMGPYAYKGSQWVSFDDADSIRRKAQFVRNMNLGGGMVWALDLDDFRGRCGEGPHPLMHTLQQVLSEPPNQLDEPIKPPSVGSDLEWKMPVASDITSTAMPTTLMEPEHTTSVIKPDDSKGFKVVCYFTNWAWYRQEGGKFVPEDIDGDLCTHIIYGFAVLDGSSLTIKTHDSWADIDNKFYERVVAYKSKGIKVLLAIGGWNDSAGDKYSRLVNSASARQRFISHVLQFLEKYGFEGLDLDWEYPVCWQVDCNKGPKSDKESFALLVQHLSKVFKPKGLLLSAAVSPSKRVVDAGYDVISLAKYLDWISVMTYDYHGQWDKKTGHVAPLYALPNDWERTFNANFSVHYWLEQGVPPKKLVMGAPMYGQSFSLAQSTQRGLNAPTYGGGEAGEATRARGFLSYYEICERTLKKGWSVVQDSQRRIGPYAYKGDQWVSFDDAKQIRKKAELIKKLGLGGGMIWALDLDDFKNRCGCEPSPLLRTMNRVLRNYPEGPLCPISSETTSIDIDETESTGSPTTESTSTSWPTYLPPATTTTTTTAASTTLTTTTTTESIISSEENDTVEIIAGPPPAGIAPLGDCGDKLFIPHKNDCAKYYLCNFGKLSERSCPNGLYWNENRCDWPENSKCKRELRQRQTSDVSMALSLNENNSKKIVCYITSWAQKRQSEGRFITQDLSLDLCTHVVYGFAILDEESLTIKMPDSWDKEDEKFLRDMILLNAQSSNPVKILIALGGWKDSYGDKYSRMTSDSASRIKFVDSIIKFINKYKFDGLDLIWEYPVCWQINCNNGPKSDKLAYINLLRDLRTALKIRRLLFSIAVSSSKKVIDIAYQVPILSEYVDWIDVMTYDYHGYWEGQTGHVAPLYHCSADEDQYMNVKSSLKYWIEKGAPSEKLMLGIPAYGQSFTLAENAIPLTAKNSNFVPSKSSGPGKPGKFSKVPGFLSYYEICDKVKNARWNVTKDPQRCSGSYATKDDQWVSYDDVSNIFKKADLIRELNLGGGSIWSLDLDDFSGYCGCGKYPLLTALNRGLIQEKLQMTDCT